MPDYDHGSLHKHPPSGDWGGRIRSRKIWMAWRYCNTTPTPT